MRKSDIRWVVGYEGLYEVTRDGSVWSTEGDRFLSSWWSGVYSRGSSGPYETVSLSDGRRRKTHYVHHLVLEAFVGARPVGLECRHLNGRRDDNRLENLQWGTPEENSQDTLRHGHFVPAPRKLTPHLVRVIRQRKFEGARNGDLAADFGVTYRHIEHVISRDRWASVA